MYHIQYVDVYNRGVRLAASQNKHQLRTQATRRKLLKSASRIFARDGFEAARIEEIARDSGHTRGAFYANFGSKEDLFFALLEQQAHEHFNNIHQLFERYSNAEERLAALREYYVRLTADRQSVMLMLEFKLFAVRHGRLRAKLAGTHRQIRSSIMKVDAIKSRLPARVQLRADADEVRRVALEAALNGLVLEHAYDSKRISEDQVASILRRIFDLLMQPEPSHAG